MIVIEGPDGAGKTILVNHLAEKFSLNVGSRGVANRDRLYEVTRRDTYRALSEAVSAEHRPQVWDRLFVSEFVYHDIQPGRPCEFTAAERRFVVDVMDGIGFPMIACLPPLEVVRENVMKVHQMEGVKEGLDEIYHRYANRHLPWPQNVIWYDYTGSQRRWFADLSDVEEEVAGYIDARKVRQAWDL